MGQSYEQNVDVTLPITAQGTWYVYVVPDGTGCHHPFAMPEISRTDKLAISAGFSVTLSPPPDLAVTSVQAPAQRLLRPADEPELDGGQHRYGPDRGQLLDRRRLHVARTRSSTPTRPSWGRSLIKGCWRPGAATPTPKPSTLPVGVSGSFYFLVQTDVNGQVFENGATANNVAATTAAETVNLTPPPDLEVELDHGARRPPWPATP